MSRKQAISKRFTAFLVYGRPPFAFAGLVCAIAVMWSRMPVFGEVGLLLLLVAMTFDLVDGWFAARWEPTPSLASLADRLMDKVLYSTIFPLLAVGMMWRLGGWVPGRSRGELLLAILTLIVCITVLVRDNFAHFIRGYGSDSGVEPEGSEFSMLRTTVAAPVAVLLYAHAFYLPGPALPVLGAIHRAAASLPLQVLFVIEIIFLIINFGSIAGYCRKYGSACLDELCSDDERLRRRILSFLPNTLTILNAIMGGLALFFTHQGRIREAYLLLIGAAIFDKLDGALARRLGLTTPLPGEEAPRRFTLGGIMDDIADAVSFCTVPALMFYIVVGGWRDPVLSQLPAAWVALIYAILGMSRLVYFTLDRSPIPGFFKGMPVPAAALLVTAPLMIFDQARVGPEPWAYFWAVFCTCLMLLVAVMMNLYPVHYIHLGRFMDRHPWFGRFTLGIIIVFAFTPFFGYIALTYLMFYLFSPLLTWRLEPGAGAAEQEASLADSRE